MSKKTFLALLLLCPLNIFSIEFMKDYLDYGDEKPLPTVDNDFIYGDGTTEVTTQVSDYENIVANVPIKGSIFVTHTSKNAIDANSFKIGDKPLKVTLVQSATMSSYSDIVVTIYSFELPGLPIGTHTLPAIHVKVAGKDVQALPLVIEVAK